MDVALRQLVRARAEQRCEYCHLPESFANAPFQIDHIIAEKHQGPTIESNLAWSCYECNTFKGPNLAGWIAESDEVIRLFHPRRDEWHKHFRWQSAQVIALTPIGEATLQVLRMNSSGALLRRALLIELGEFKP